MVGIGYNSYNQYSPYDKAEEAKLRNMPWNRDAGPNDKLSKVPLDEKQAENMRAKGHSDDPSCECETCKNRKYQDGSDEMVSFKSAQHISPQAAASRVRGHEAEHVSNAYKDAAMNNGKVLQASVSIRTAVCPECGRTYVAGGETCTKIAYSNEENPYVQARKDLNKQGLLGANVNLAG